MTSPNPLDDLDPKAARMLADLYLIDFHVGRGFEVSCRDDFVAVPGTTRTYETAAAVYVVGDDTVSRFRGIGDARVEAVVYARGVELSREVLAADR
jgi:hypothetical protein